MPLFDRSTVWACLAGAALAAGAVAKTPLGHVEKRGGGPTPVILISGVACDWTVWEAFMERNKDAFTMYAVTLPGMAGTQPPPKPEQEGGTPWFDASIAALSALINDKGLVKPVVVGHSLGGHLALRLALDHPEQVGRVVMLDSMPSFPVGGGSIVGEQRSAIIDGVLTPQIRQQDASQWQESFAREAMSMVSAADRSDQIREMLRTTDGAVTVQYFIEGLRSDQAPRLGSLRVPTLIIAAMNDRLPAGMNADQARAYWAGIDGLSEHLDVVIFENTRHFVMDDRSAATDAAIRAVVKGEKAAGVGVDAGPPDGVVAPPKAGERPADKAPATAPETN
ncbi:MAG: alpha/beta hydrolase [Phycisphaerales bacterium]|nr:alpha/beta hydrolase [Phycisphaerales bacterium]